MWVLYCRSVAPGRGSGRLKGSRITHFTFYTQKDQQISTNKEIKKHNINIGIIKYSHRKHLLISLDIISYDFRTQN